MSYILQPNVTGSPMNDESGKLNLQDWRLPANVDNILFRDTVTLPDRRQIKLSQSPNMPSPEVVALSDEDLTFVSNEGNFPEAWCLLYLRGLTEEVRAFAPMLSVNAFVEQHGKEIADRLEANIQGEQGQEWVEYYTEALYEYPIFKIALFNVSQDARDKIGQEYFKQYHDVKYLSQEQVSELTAEHKVQFLKSILKEHANDTGKRTIAMQLLSDVEELSTTEAASILGLAPNSIVAGELLTCRPFVATHDNAHNTVVTWIQHCIAEKIGTNQSVWYNTALGVELEHGLNMASQYVKIMPGQAIGGISTIARAPGESELIRSYKPGNKPIGL